jgi:putative protease
MTELLAPAGGWDALVAAVQSGADAVYLGFGSFNARRSAKNFTREEFARAVLYCHERGVRVYLTLNTLLSDRELPDAAEDARFACAAGADAVLVQDWGVWSLLREVAPDLPVHASTQMSIHTLSGAQRAAALGAARVVLARELSKEDIAEICRGCDAEIEVFVHGALCMCYSGQCAMSALIGGRSGNRGRCAQPCRMAYAVNGGKTGYPLSLKDYNLSAELGALSGMGVACLKLEGRMKRPEYVAVVTDIYARLLRQQRRPTAEEEKALTDAFSRSGFTDWYYRGKRGAGMFGTRPENAPEPKELFAAAKARCEKENARLTDVTFSLTAVPGEPMILTAAADSVSVTVTGAVPEAARSRAVTAEELTARLQKTGGTAYRCAAADARVSAGLSVSAAAVNDLRRRALAALTEERIRMPERLTYPETPFSKTHSGPAAPELTVSVTRAGQLTEELLSYPLAAVYVPLELFPALDVPALARRAKLVAVLPRIFRTGEEGALRRQLAALAPHLAAVAVGNLGHFPIAEGLGLPLWGDFGLNVFNSRALAFLKEQGLAAATVSFELHRAQIRDLDKCLPCEAIVYGRLPLMITENCLIRNSGACDGTQRTCQKESNTLTDRTGARFPLLGVHGCRTEIENSRVLYLADREDYKKLGLTYARLRFTDEEPRRCAEVLRAYLGQSDCKITDFTRGLFDRGVE